MLRRQRLPRNSQRAQAIGLPGFFGFLATFLAWFSKNLHKSEPREELMVDGLRIPLFVMLPLTSA